MLLTELDSVIVRNLISTLLMFTTIFFLRVIFLRGLEKWKFPTTEVRRKWIVQIRNTAILLGLLGLLFIWGDELKAFAVSVVAIAAALVIATKELILCLLGGVMKYSMHLFSIGDRIEINNWRGDVISHNMFVTTVNEIGPGKDMHQFTGRTISIPNGILLTNPVINETETGDYVLHVFRVPFDRHDNWREEKQKLLLAAQDVCRPHIRNAKQQFDRLATKEGLESPSIEPRVSIAFPEPQRVDLVVRIPAPCRRKGKIEQEILLKYCGLIASTDHSPGLGAAVAMSQHL